MVRKQKYCDDPLNKHKKCITVNVKWAPTEIIENSGGILKENALLCQNCISILRKDPNILLTNEENKGKIEQLQDSSSSTSNECVTPDEMEPSTDSENITSENNLISVLPLLEQTPIKKKGLTLHQKKLKVQKKLSSGSDCLKKQLEMHYGVEILNTQRDVKDDSVSSNPQMQLKLLMNELKHSFLQGNSYKRKLQILTLSPYTIKETAKFFNTTPYMVKKSRSLKKEHGILPEIPTMSKGMVVNEEQKNEVIKFYESDEISRMCPGIKDCLKVRDAEGNVFKAQKRLVLGNLKEIFELYKKDQNPKIGFSTFAKLRPSYCVLAGSAGTHCVCVCTYHQNPKLQVAALGEKGLTYKDLMDFSVCSIENEDCMMMLCEDCPREEGVRHFLELLESVESAPEEIIYKQWVTVDRCTLFDRVEPLHEYLSSLSKNISNLVRHHYVAQEQSKYFKKLKETLPDESEVVIVGDFSENYSFIVQDAAQGFHWENSQCTVHPFVVYYKSGANQEMNHFSVCFLSACLQHNTIMVYSFLAKLLPYVRLKCPNVQKVHYFSDGCAGQYKNRFNFINLCYHKEDFDLECEWNFFATSHGKNACDGIGGTVKRAIARASLRRTTSMQILTPDDMFDYCERNLSANIKYFFINGKELKLSEEKLRDRFQNIKSILGTQKYHRFVPINKEELMVYPISNGTGEKKTLKKKDDPKFDKALTNLKAPKVGEYVGCIYNRQVWYGIVEVYSEEFDDFTINFLHHSGLHGSTTYHFPPIKDSCPVPGHYMLKVMSYPTLRAGSRVNYTFTKEECDYCIQRAEIILSQE